MVIVPSAGLTLEPVMAKAKNPAPKADDIGAAPNTLIPSRLAAGVDPGFVIGETDRQTDDRIVAVAVRVRCEVKSGERDASGSSFCLHEIPVMSKMYEELGGHVRIEPGWPPGHTRFVPLTRAQLERELARLNETTQVPQANGTLVSLLPAFFGSEPADQLKRLRDAMQAQYEAFVAEAGKAAKRLDKTGTKGLHPEIIKSMAYDAILPRDLERIANLADPTKDGTGDIDLPAVAFEDIRLPGSADSSAPATPVMTPAEAEAAAAQLDDGGGSAGRNQRVVDALTAQGLDGGAVAQLADLVDLSGGPDSITDDIERTTGKLTKTKLAAVRSALKG